MMTLLTRGGQGKLLLATWAEAEFRWQQIHYPDPLID